MGTALAAGLTLDYLFTFQGVSHVMPEGRAMLPHWLRSARPSAIAMLAWALVQPLLASKTATAPAAETRPLPFTSAA